MTLASRLDRAWQTIYNKARRTVTHRVIAESYDSDDNLVKTPTDTSVEAVVQRITEEEVEELPGTLTTGDMWIFTQPTVTVNEDVEWVIDGIVWKTVTFHTEEVSGIDIFNEVLARRIDDE